MPGRVAVHWRRYPRPALPGPVFPEAIGAESFCKVAQPGSWPQGEELKQVAGDGTAEFGRLPGVDKLNGDVVGLDGDAGRIEAPRPDEQGGYRY
jgi:hypothetical protein